MFPIRIFYSADVNVLGGGLYFDAGINESSLDASVNKIERQLKKMSQTANEQANSVENYAKRAAAAMASYAGIFSATSLVADLTRVRGEFQRLETVLTNTFGSSSEAKDSLALISDYVAKTSFELDEVSNSYVKLVNQGIKPTRQELTALGDLAASTGKGFDQLTEAILDAQTGEFERLKEFGIRAEKAGDQVKFSFKGVQTQVDFTSEAIKNYVISLGNLNGVSGATAAISATIQGKLSNLSDAYTRVMNEIGASSEGIISGSIEVATSLVENYETVLDVLKALVVTYGSYKTATLLATGVTNGYTIAETLRRQAMLLSERAMKLLNATMLKNPAVALTTVIAGLASAIVFLGKKTQESSVITQEYNAELQKEKAGLSGLFEIVQRTAEGTKERKDAIVEINKQYGNYLPNLLTEKTTNQELAKAYELLNKRIEENIALKFKNKNVDELQKQYGDKNDQIQSDLISGISEQFGPKVAAEATKELAKLGEDLSKLEERRRSILNKTIAGTKKDANDLFVAQSNLLRQFAGKYKVERLDNLRELGLNQFELTKGLKDIDTYWNGIIGAGKAGADNAKKTLDDYLKEKDFAAVFNQALPLATSKPQLQKVLEKLSGEKGSLDRSAKDFESKVKYYQGLIDQVQQKIDAYDPKKAEKANAAAAKEQESVESKVNSVLEKRKGILEQIADLHRDASQSAFADKETSAIDKINERYDKIIASAKEYNNLFEEINKKFPGGVVAFNAKQIRQGKPQNIVREFTDADFAEINKDRSAEVFKENLKKQFEVYGEELERQKKLFQDYENKKREIGIDAANQMYSEQTRGAQSYIDFLESEIGLIASKKAFGSFTDADKEKLKLLNKELMAANDDRVNQERDRLAELLNLTASYNQKAKLLEINRAKDVAALQKENAKKFTAEELKQRTAALNKFYDDQTKDLANQFISLSPIFQKLGQDMFRASRPGLLKLKADLTKTLKDGFVEVEGEGGIKQLVKLTPEARAELEKTAKEVNVALGDLFLQLIPTNEQEKLGRQLANVSRLANDISQSFKSVADHVRDTNKELAETLETTATLLDIGASGLQAAAGVLTGDFGSAIQGITNYYSGIFDFVFAAPKRSIKEAQAALEQFAANQVKGEQEVLRLQRERQLEAIRLNDITLERISAERELLEDQKNASQEQYEAILRQIAAEGAVVGLRTERTKGILGIGRKTQVVEVTESLAGKNYDQLEKLFLSGQLTGRAKELFEQLQQLKQEGVDIDRQLRDLQRESQQIFTGTTADNLSNSLKEMFRQGKTSAQDFADFFQNAMQDAALSIFQSKFIAARMDEFYKQFAADAESGGGLDRSEIDRLRNLFNSDMEALNKQFEQLREVTKLDFGAMGYNSANGLSGAIQGITAQQADLLAGQFGGMRLTMIEVQKISNQQLSELNRIQFNTAATVERLSELVRKFSYYENNGLPVRIR